MSRWSPEQKSKVRQSGSKLGGCIAVPFFLIFAVAGGAMFYFISYRPLASLVAARSWTAVPCTILTSEVEESSGSDGSTYSVAITYSYQYGGVSYQGDRYDFSFGSTSGYSGKAEVVAAYPPGLEARCFVDPEDPSRAVIDRSPGLYLLWSLFPLPFLLVGLGGVFFMLRSGKGGEERKARRGARAHERPAAPETRPVAGDGSLVLEPRHTPLVKLIGVTIFALIWNGIVGVFVYQIVQDYRSGGEPEGCAVLFLIPFVLVGLGLIGGIVYQLLALFNPRPHLVLAVGRLEPGTSSSLSWQLTGQVSRLDKLTIELEGREAATYRRGTNTVTDHETFFQEVLLDVTSPRVRRGEVTLSVPEGTMPSFEASNNKIEWRITLHGDIPRWPDVKEEFVVTVYPPAGGFGR